MKLLYNHTCKRISGGILNPCPGGWEYSESNGYLTTEKHWKCYAK